MREVKGPDQPILEPLGTHSLRWIRALWIGVLVVYAAIFALSFHRVGQNDHDQFLVFQEIQCWNVELFGEVPRQWTPVMCGGISAAGDPQVAMLAPRMLAAYWLGPFYGHRVVLILFFVLGWLLAFGYAGLWLRRFDAKALAASLFIGNGFFVCRMGYGHASFVQFTVLPGFLWALHCVGPWTRRVAGAPRVARTLVALLLGGMAFALMVDGAPQMLVYLMFWVGIYGLVLAVQTRSGFPLALIVGSGLLALVLDAAFLWSMLDSMRIHPRLWPDQFTNPLTLLFYAAVPARGNFPLLPAPDNGYELSVFVGVVLLYALVRFGRPLWKTLPREMRGPLLVTSLVAAWVGMGSLRPLGVPTWLSPFDLLRELPGFRSVGVTGRYWGFLALPLSLLGAAALWRLAASQKTLRALAGWMVAACALQFGFQAGTVGVKLLKSRVYEPVATAGLFEGSGERVTYEMRVTDYQGEQITPVVGVIDCFDMIDFIRPCMVEGDRLVQRVEHAHEETRAPLHLDGVFETWSRIRLDQVAPWPGPPPTVPEEAEVRLVLNQAWHPYWSSADCGVERHAEGNLVAVTTPADLARGPIRLVFHDAISVTGWHVSLVAWPVALGLCLLLLPFARRRRR